MACVTVAPASDQTGDSTLASDTSLIKLGLRAMLTRFILLNGYYQLCVDILPAEGDAVVTVELLMEGVETSRASVSDEPIMMMRHYPMKSVRSVCVDGLLSDRHEKKPKEPLDFQLIVGTQSGLTVVFSREELASTYPDQYNNLASELWSRIRACSSGRFLEIGGRGQASARVRSMMPPGWEYISVDIHPGDNVDIVADLHTLSKSLSPNSVDVIYSSSVFEHIFQPWLAVVECAKILKVDGHMYTAVPQAWPRHSEPWDFWRFMEGSWPALFNPLSGFEIINQIAIEEAKAVPVVMCLPNRAQLSGSSVLYLQIACLARKIGEPQQTWTYAKQSLEGQYPESGVLQPPSC